VLRQTSAMERGISFGGENGKRKCKSLGHFSSKAKAWAAAKPYRDALDAVSPPSTAKVGELVTQYRVEKMPQRASTRRGYEGVFRNYILPKWQGSQITELQARPVELWIQSLKLAPKSKVHIRGLIQTLWDYAMWRGDVPTQRNPMELVHIRNASKRLQKPRTMTIEEFHRLSAVLTEPYRTMATVGVCLGLRWSEIVGLQWQDIDWLNGELRLQRAVVKQIEDAVKTVHSSKPIALGLSPRRKNMESCPGATRLSGKSWVVRVTMRASSTFRLTAFGTAIVRGLMSWARRLLCSNAPCDTGTSA